MINKCYVCENGLIPNRYKEYENNKFTGRYTCGKCYTRKLRYGYYIIPEKKYIYNDSNNCYKCGDKLYPHNARKEYDDNGNWSKKWLCEKCGNKHRQRLPNGYLTLMKFLSDRRMGILSPNSTQYKGDKFEELTSRWRGVKILSRELDNYTLPYDHSRDPELGIIQTKGCLYNTLEGTWHNNVLNDHNKKFDYLIFYCAIDTIDNGTIIERIYIFPMKEIIIRTGISITKNPSRGIPWYEEYRILDENILKLINDIWKTLISKTL